MHVGTLSELDEPLLLRLPMRFLLALLLLVLLVPGPALGQESQASPSETTTSDGGRGIGHKLLLYLPNRLFDLMDVVRLRARVGPGFGAGARATKPLSVTAGFYSAVWAGLPGPRGKRTISLPVGLEALSGAKVSVIDVAAEGGLHYGRTEFGAGAQVFIIGADVGVDPGELLDLVGGLILIDFRKDDL